MFHSLRFSRAELETKDPGHYKLLQSIRECSSDLSLSVPNILTWLRFRIICYVSLYYSSDSHISGKM
jgi:hypothetical protein